MSISVSMTLKDDFFTIKGKHEKLIFFSCAENKNPIYSCFLYEISWITHDKVICKAFRWRMIEHDGNSQHTHTALTLSIYFTLFTRASVRLFPIHAHTHFSLPLSSFCTETQTTRKKNRHFHFYLTRNQHKQRYYIYEHFSSGMGILWNVDFCTLLVSVIIMELSDWISSKVSVLILSSPVEYMIN